MILSDTSILAAIKRGEIVIDPFDPARLGSNSYDVRLGETLAVYDGCWDVSSYRPIGSEKSTTEIVPRGGHVLDAKLDNPVIEIEIPKEGFVLRPGLLYLGVTAEYTETHAHVPFLEGKSSTGRLGIDIHATAGKGDIGFKGVWTLEISVVHPVRVYAGMPIGQLIYFAVDGEVATPYDRKASAKYNNRSDKPQGSKMYLNFR